MNIGIIGYGNIGKKHHQAIDLIKDVRLKAICDQRDLDVKGVPTYKSLNAFFENSKLDLVSVCTPNALHKAHSIMSLNYDLDVICEKPFALTTEDCQLIIDTAKRNKRRVFCVMQNRFSSVMQWLKSTVDSGKMGKIFLVNINCYWNRNKEYYKNSNWRGTSDVDGGTLFTQFSHYVDMLYWLFGSLQIENALFDNFNHEDMISFEDTGIFNFKMKEGGLGTFAYTTSTYEKNFESTLTIIGEKGTIKIGGQYMNQLQSCNIKGVEYPHIEKSENLDHLKQVYLNALDNIRNKADVMTTSEDGKNVVNIIEDIYAFKTENDGKHSSHI